MSVSTSVGRSPRPCRPSESPTASAPSSERRPGRIRARGRLRAPRRAEGGNNSEPSDVEWQSRERVRRRLNRRLGID